MPSAGDIRAGEVQRFEAAGFWSSNVCGAAIGGIGIGAIMLVVMFILVTGNPTRSVLEFAATVVLVIFFCVACLFMGNLVAVYPYAVSIIEGIGLELHAPLKKVFIPFEDISGVRKAFPQGGYSVDLKRSHGLIKQFLIPGFFGAQTEPLAEAIRQQIRR